MDLRMDRAASFGRVELVRFRGDEKPGASCLVMRRGAAISCPARMCTVVGCLVVIGTSSEHGGRRPESGINLPGLKESTERRGRG